MSRVDAHIKQPRFVSATRLVMKIPARTLNRQLPNCGTASFWIDDSFDMSPVCELSVDDVVISGIIAGTHHRLYQHRVEEVK